MLRLFTTIVLLCTLFAVPVLSLTKRPHLHSFEGSNVIRTIPSIEPRSANRLLNTTEPLHYNLELTSLIHVQDTTFTGRIDIRFRVLEPTTLVRLNSYLLDITSCTLSNANSANIAVSCGTMNRFLDVVSAEQLQQNQEYVLQVSFTGTNRAPSNGFHSSYYTIDGVRRYLASTQFQSVFASEAFPCFDEPFYRVPIRITIRHHPSYNALSNAEIESSQNGVTVFRETWQLPSYLIAFVVSDFECTEKLGKQRICAQPNRMNEVGLAVEASDKILTWMETTFDEDYEHEKLDHIAIPTFQFGGMENWGLVVYQ